jgi:hypothetical protein
MLLAPLSKHAPDACRAIMRTLVAAGLSCRQVDENMMTVLHIASSQVRR